ncbi:MAG: hypothetical protein ACRDSJ_07145 [Rubrobacteraceae bacterium]
MRNSNHTAREVVRRGREIYERDIRRKVEPEFEGKFIVVDVVTGGYVIADNDSEAFDRAQEKHPDGVHYVARIGHRAPYRIGLHPGASR